eukprot:s168_g5.t1
MLLAVSLSRGHGYEATQPPGANVHPDIYGDLGEAAAYKAEWNSCFETLQATADTKYEESVQPLSRMVKQGRRGSTGSLDKSGDGNSRWWTRSRQQLMCPLTNFPIQLLPYPPFKLRTEPWKQTPHTLVDGKFLALQLIANGRSGPGIRELLPSDLTALDEYIHRCKLGPFRPGVARGLAEQTQTAPTQAERARASKELQKLRSKTRSELGKLRRIQENRLAQLSTPEEEHLPEKEDKGQDSAIVGHASPQEVDIPTSEFFRPLQVKGIELKRLHLPGHYGHYLPKKAYDRPKALKPLVRKLVNVLRVLSLGRHHRRSFHSSSARFAGRRLSDPYSEGEQAFLAKVLSFVPLMARSGKLMLPFLTEAGNKSGDLAATTIHQVKILTARAVWKDLVEPLKEEIEKSKTRHTSLQEVFNETRSEYLREVAALRDEVRIRGDPEKAMALGQMKDVMFFFEPMKTLQPHELQYCLEVVKEKLKMIFEENAAVTQTVNFGQVDRLKELLVNAEEILNRKTAEIMELERERRHLQRELAIVSKSYRDAQVSVEAANYVSESNVAEMSQETEKLRAEIGSLKDSFHGVGKSEVPEATLIWCFSRHESPAWSVVHNMSGKAAARQIVRSCNYGGLEETRFRRESMLKKTTDELRAVQLERDDAMQEMKSYQQKLGEAEAQLQGVSQEMEAIRREVRLLENQEALLKLGGACTRPRGASLRECSAVCFCFNLKKTAPNFPRAEQLERQRAHGEILVQENIALRKTVGRWQEKRRQSLLAKCQGEAPEIAGESGVAEPSLGAEENGERSEDPSTAPPEEHVRESQEAPESSNPLAEEAKELISKLRECDEQLQDSFAERSRMSSRLLDAEMENKRLRKALEEQAQYVVQHNAEMQLQHADALAKMMGRLRVSKEDEEAGQGPIPPSSLLPPMQADGSSNPKHDLNGLQ